MATPTTGTLNVIGSAGGMAPFPTSVYADPDEAGSTWAAGAWQPVGSGDGSVAGYSTDGAISYLSLSAGGQFIVLET